MYMKKYEDDKPTCENNNTFLQFRMYVCSQQFFIK